MSAVAEAINKIIERVPESRFMYVNSKPEFRIVVNGEFYWLITQSG